MPTWWMAIMDMQDTEVMATAFTISKSIKIMSTTGGSIDTADIVLGVNMVIIGLGYKVSFDNITINPDNIPRRGL